MGQSGEMQWVTSFDLMCITITMIHEYGPLLSGMAALMAVMLAALRFLQDRSERRIKTHHEQTVATTMREVLREMARQTLRDIEGVPLREIYCLDVRLQSGRVMGIPMVLRRWVQYLPGLSLMLTRTDREETEFFMEVSSPSFLPWHSHEEQESIWVIRGWMTDMSSGKRYGAGEFWKIDPEAMHRAWFEAGTLCRVVVRPPLLTAKERPVDLRDMETAFDYEEGGKNP
jgi:hypothetical protein